MQTFNDQNKNLMLTQLSIIQRINQRLIICLIVVFSNMNLYLRDIIQTYVQSITSLNRDFFVRSFAELIKHLDMASNSILKMIKSLYDVFEIDNHWFVTYPVYHVNKLDMIQSIYDFCFFHTNMKIDTSSIFQISLKNDHLMRIIFIQIWRLLTCKSITRWSWSMRILQLQKKRQSLMLKSWLNHEIVSIRFFR
jgi:hypothetical protein